MQNLWLSYDDLGGLCIWAGMDALKIGMDHTHIGSVEPI
jgi:hypothetical protein